MTAVAVTSGFVDSVAGGGGLIAMPSLLWAGLPPHLALGTNKLQSLFGTGMATRNYFRAGLFRVRPNLATAFVVALCSIAGAVMIQHFSSNILKILVPVLLVAIALYTLLSPRMDDDDSKARLGEKGFMPVVGSIGFYDGFFGPGTGQFFTASLVSLRGLGLTRATGLTKLFNFASNVAAALVFAISGQIDWILGLCMAAGAMTGGWIGSRTALRHGARFIRPMVITMSLILTSKLVWDWFVA